MSRVFVLLASLVIHTLGCGMTTHQVIAHRAFSYYFQSVDYPEYRTLALRHTGALLAGAPFPDYL